MGVVVGEARPKVHKSTVRRLSSPFEPEDSDAEVLSKVLAFYQRELPHDAAARSFLEAHGVSAEAVQVLGLGVGNRSLGLHLPHKKCKRGQALRARLGALGLVRETGHEHMRGTIVVPLLDAEGQVLSLYGHKIAKRYGEHFFTNSERRGLFNAPGLVGRDAVVIADTVLSALGIWSVGWRAVTALPGADEPLEELLGAVKGARRVTLALPRSAELVKVTSELVAALSGLGIEVLQVVFPGAQSATDVLRERDGAYRLGQLLRSAEWVGGAARETELGEPRAAEQRQAQAALAPASAEADQADEQVYAFSDRRWRVRGLTDNRAPGTLRLNVFVMREQAGFHVDSFDLYSARHRKSFLQQAALELGVEEAQLKRDLGQVLLALEIAQAKMLEELRAPVVKVPEMSEAERRQALELLCDPQLLERVLEAFSAMGIVGERDNLLAGYLVAISRKLSEPLGLVLQSSSAGGKSALFDAILSLVPEEERLSYAAISGQSLYYMGKRSLRHRLLCVSEEVGAEKASHALKLLQTSRELTIASTGKDGASGRITSHEYKVEGPVALMITTSKVELEEELLHRCLVLSVDESPEQTRAVQAAQQKAHTLEGILVAERRAELERLHQNAQRLLRPLLVVNPHAIQIDFHDRRVRGRREHKKLLSLIEAIALVHQHQRPLERHVIIGERVLEYIEATAEDVALAERLMAVISGSATDELSPRTRELAHLLERYVAEQLEQGARRRPFLFSRREIREALGWGDTQLKTHLRRLVEAELVLVHRADHGRGVAYELCFERAERAERAGYGRPKGGLRSGQGRGTERDANGLKQAANASAAAVRPEIALSGPTNTERVPKAS